ncbi:hypothetical protein H8S90_05795 [Olivibacter sp. SDN3]|uniref:SIR2 family protein n=1 Tax=Olivibacter sp. SDN3 TaxID=2764720 RepID=UPI001651557C|nr:SIR2 family protein [Olivibacter sp. SDN3]QNL51096.1 hypothetical protein H8S90_05795 [Olivibacter sp. SDN3]
MPEYVLLVGNDINNISPGKSWNELLEDIKAHFNVGYIQNEDKPFPMLYEEIFLGAVENGSVTEEKNLKTFIAENVSKIISNEFHEEIRQLPVSHIMTTNYEFAIEGIVPENNNSIVKETTYSLFRRYMLADKTYWHIHGDCNNPSSINLGYEHYCGQLQGMRNYTVSGTNYTSKAVIKTPLIRRLAKGKQPNYQSWIDLFFTKDVYIFGLSLDYVESDLWWLLTYRARNKFYRKSAFIKNKIHYFIPLEYAETAKGKLTLLKANDVDVHVIKQKDKQLYYKEIISLLKHLA